jgi:hypothetical protein|eukprot:COSAG02_NODE_311_length_24966_cov_1089.426187_17_plen_111_part_00
MVQVQFEDWSYHLEPRWVHLSTASTRNVWTILPHSPDTNTTDDTAGTADADNSEPSPHSAGELCFLRNLDGLHTIYNDFVSVESQHVAAVSHLHSILLLKLFNDLAAVCW